MGWMIKLKGDLKPNEYVIVCINKETKEAEYVAYMEDAHERDNNKADVITSDDLDYIAKKLDFLFKYEDFERYTDELNTVMRKFNPNLEFRLCSGDTDIHKLLFLNLGFSEEVEGVVHRPRARYNQEAYKEDYYEGYFNKGE